MDITLGLATGDDATLQEAAEVWAAACNERDRAERSGRDVVGGLRGRMRMRGAELLVAQRDPDVVGFAITVPTAPGVVEIFYLATDPGVWGQGVAQRLLDAAESLARFAKAERAELWVIEVDDRARSFYEQAGYCPTGDMQDTEAGRPEARYAKQL